MSTPESAGALLTIDLNIIRSNYRRLCQEMGGKDCAAVVKADAYGLGVGPVSKALWEEGARTFFIAQIDEGIELRRHLPEADIHVLVGFLAGSDNIFKEHNLIPVLNTLDQIKRWDDRGRCDLQIDTGMTRLGIAMSDLDHIPSLSNIDILMSHLACADDPDHWLTPKQITNFTRAKDHIPHQRASLANSSGIFNFPAAHHDLGRPGCALYGINPTVHQNNPMENPVHLQGKIVQIHDISDQEVVGYSATHKLQAGQKIATVALGYADGYLRYLSSKGVVYIKDQPAPIVGRVSMDLISIDVTNIDCHEGGLVDVIGPNNTPDDLARLADTIGYEILTSLGSRYLRIYKS